jgi:hypothetical protein
MPFDIAQDVYRYLARDWGLQDEKLTDKKCQLLKKYISLLRVKYQKNRKIPYHKAVVRRTYLATFAPRYAYTLYHCLSKTPLEAKQVLDSWHNKDAVMCMLGGGPACELYGLLDWLYENGIEPRYLHVVLCDRQAYWRTFHSFLFADILAARFKKTLIVPTYETVDFPVQTGKKFNRLSVNYGFAQHAMLAEAKLITVVNCLSELPDHRGFECHLRYLTRLAWSDQLVVCADSNARKWRPRMSWLKDHFDKAENFESKELHCGSEKMEANWLTQDATTQKIFGVPSPKWETSINRWVYIRKTGE